MKYLAKISCLALAVTLAGCSGDDQKNRSLDSVHQPIVRNQVFAFDVNASNGELPPSEQRRLTDWLEAMNVGYGDRIAVEDPSLYGNGAATQAIGRIVGRYGLLMSDAVPVTAGTIAPGALRVTLTRASASVPGCPNWASSNSNNPGNATSSNYGCATNSNLAAMVADPNDLIKGASTNRNDPTSATKPIQAFREKKPSGTEGLANTSTSGGGQ